MFKNLMKAVVGVAVLPLDIATDVVTLGGAIIGEEEPATMKRLKQIGDNVNLATDPEEAP